MSEDRLVGRLRRILPKGGVWNLCKMNLRAGKEDAANFESAVAEVESTMTTLIDPNNSIS